MTILCTSSICSTCMPSFFIIAFIWRGLIFPGSIFLTTLPYSYCYSIIKCKHLRAGNYRSTASNQAVIAGNNQHIIPGAYCRISRGHMFCKGILALCDKLCDILTDNDAVAGWREQCLETFCPLDTQCQPAIRRPDRCEAHPPKENLTYPPGC